MGVTMVMGVRVMVGMVVGDCHFKMLYYNITRVHLPSPTLTGLERTAGGMTNAMDNDPAGVRSVEDYIGVRAYGNAARIAFVGGPASLGMISKQANDRL